MLIEAIDVCKDYRDETVLRNVSFTVAAGQSLAITGASGSGKSTLLSMLGLLLQPSAGEVRFRGRSVSDISDNERSRLRNSSFGFIFQNPQLIGSLSVLDNVLVPARLARRKGVEAEARKILDSLGLGQRLKHLPHQLSIGQKRRVAVARALLLGPEVVFADEPTNDLDAGLAGRIADYLLELPRSGVALVYVTHDRSFSQRADRSVTIADGLLHHDQQ